MEQAHLNFVEYLEGELAESERQTRAQMKRVAKRDVEIKRLRRALDFIKVRAYEMDNHELHDMALEALQGANNETN